MKNTTKHSFGVIALRVSKLGHLQVLLVRRKDSLAACDFLNSSNRITVAYMHRIAKGITFTEQQMLLYMDMNKLLERTVPIFSEQISNKRRKRLNWRRSHIRRRVNKLRNTYLLKEVLLRNRSNWVEPEWEFPKGRQNSTHEKEHACAAREFSEETGIAQSNLRLYDTSCTESYIGTNNVHYCHRYYLGTVCDDAQPIFDPYQFIGQRYEISGVRWVNVDNAHTLFRPYTARIKSDCLQYFIEYVLMHPYCIIRNPELGPIGPPSKDMKTSPRLMIAV